jgi:ABC-type lipoprotein export system ATPase subunit
LLSVLAGYQKLDQGAAGYGTDLSALDPIVPGRVAWVPQGSNVMGARTALDNVMVAPLSEGVSLYESRAIASATLDEVGLGERMLDQARSLSGGELQRVAFARALATSKPFILADEPSASLDSSNTRTLADLLSRLRSRATIIVATHDPIIVDSAQAVVRLRTGTADGA